MTIYVTGDVHGRAEYGASRFSSKAWPLGRTLTRDDVVIVAGDFGFVWDGSNAERYWLTTPWLGCRYGSGTAGSSTRRDRTCCT